MVVGPAPGSWIKDLSTATINDGKRKNKRERERALGPPGSLTLHRRRPFTWRPPRLAYKCPPAPPPSQQSSTLPPFTSELADERSRALPCFPPSLIRFVIGLFVRCFVWS